MSDADLRALERAWKTSGSLDDELAWLRATARAAPPDWEQYARLAALDVDEAAAYLRRAVAAGTITDAGTRLAALCAHPPARALHPLLPAPHGDVGAFAAGAPWAHAIGETDADLGLGSARVALAYVREAVGRSSEARPRLSLVEAWVLCPCAAHAERCLSLRIPPRGNLLGSLALLLRSPESHVRPRFILQTCHTALMAGATHEGCVARLALEVLPWCLGFADPLRRGVTDGAPLDPGGVDEPPPAGASNGR